MTTLEQAARQALEALEAHADIGIKADKQIAALRQALEQPKQEPVAWGAFYFGGKRNGKLYSACDTKEQIEHYIADRHQSDDSNTFRAAPLYTEPPKREPLTDEQVEKIIKSNMSLQINLAGIRADFEADHGIGEQ